MSKAAVEVRPQVLPVNDIDEIIIRGGNVHIERMSNDGWFMGIEAADGSYWQFWFGAKNYKSHVEFRHTETSSAEVEKIWKERTKNEHVIGYRSRFANRAVKND